MAEVFSGHHSQTGEVQQMPRLTNTLLNGTNYPSWARSVYLTLHSKGKLSHVTGKTEKSTETKTSTETITEATQPKTNTEQISPEWDQNDTTVMTWLLNSMEPQIARLFMYINSAKEIWYETKEMYGQDHNLSCIFHLKQEISQLKQGTKTVTEYFGDLKAKWNEYAFYTQTTDLKALELDQIFQFLSGLDRSYESARAQILLSKELPTLRSIVAMIQREESHRVCMNPQTISESENQAFFVNRRNPNPKGEMQGGPSTVKCENCKKDGHGRDQCWFLYPHLPYFHRNLAIISVLIATVTFAAIFTMPGGYIADDHMNRGTPILSRKYAFKVFIVADSLAFLLSIFATAWLIYAGSGNVDIELRQICLGYSLGMVAIAAKATLCAFSLAIYTILYQVNLGISILVFVASFGLLPFSNPAIWGVLSLAPPIVKRIGWSGLYKIDLGPWASIRSRLGAWIRVNFSALILGELFWHILLYGLIFGLALI